MQAQPAAKEWLAAAQVQPKCRLRAWIRTWTKECWAGGLRLEGPGPHSL